MGISLLKKINERTPYWLKKPFSKIIRGKLINNKEFVDTYSKLSEYDSMSKDEISKVQLGMLKDTLIHAYEHTRYYHRIFDEAGIDVYNECSYEMFKKIPTLTKEDLKKNLDGILADDIADFYLVTTGGTTGEPTKVQMEKDAIYREWAFVYHYWSKFGYDYKSSKLATLRGVDLGKKLYEINPLYAEVRLNPFALSEVNIEDYIRIIKKFKAEFIYGYPSAIYNFCRIAEKKGIKLAGKFKAVLLISENLYEFQEQMIKKVLQCKVAIFYGHSERAVFAERFEAGYLFNSLYGVTELSLDNEPVVTGFINRKTPLIRYVVDDQIKPVEEGFNIIGHHSSEVLVGYNDERVSMASINVHDDTFRKVKAYQFIQNEKGKCILNIEASDNMTDVDLKKIKVGVQRKLGEGFDCTPILVKSIEATSRGKYKMLISKLNITENSGGVLNHKVHCEIVGHRDREVLYGSDGQQISVAAINFHDKTFDKVSGYQFIQCVPGKCIMNIVTEDLSRREISQIQQSVAHKLGVGVHCEVRVVDKLEVTSRGKYKMIIQETNIT